MRLLLATLLLTASALAQSITPRTISFEGAPQISQAELLKLSGLHTGASLTKADIEAAVTRMADSGYFSGIEYKFTSDSIHFLLEPSAKAATARVSYINFVWYTPQALTAEVRTRLPLFDGTVTPESPLAAQVSQALVAILKDRQNLTATVTSTAVAGGRVDYTITSPQIIVGALNIAGVDLNSDPELARVRNAISGSDYLAGVTEKSVRGNVGDALEELGYLDQSIGPITLGEPRISPDRHRVVVDLAATATPGPLYKVASVTLPQPIGKVSPRDFESENAVKAGGRPSPSLVANTTFGIQHAYERHGYLDAKVTVTPSKDTATHTTSYTYTVVPGELYRMRSLVFPATMNAQQQSILTQAWKLPKGDIYDEQQAESGPRSTPAIKACGNAEINSRLIPDHATHEVDINLTCGHPIH